jgi:hypothetical protein
MRIELHDDHATPSIRPADANVNDGGKVRLGGQTPNLPPVSAPSKIIAGAGKVRMSGQTPKP